MSLDFALYGVRRRGDQIIGTVRVFDDDRLTFMDSLNLTTVRGRNAFFEALQQQLGTACPEQRTVDSKLVALLAQAEAELDARGSVPADAQAPFDPADAAGPYRATPTGLIWLKQGRDGEVQVPLTNFVARIEADVVEDDGSGEPRRFYAMVVSLDDRIYRFTVPVERFGAMTWIEEYLPAKAFIYPGQGTRDHSRVAIKLLSGEPPVRHLYVHLGWDGTGSNLMYLHAGGAIGAAGVVPGIETRLRAPLDQFVLPPPPVAAARTAAVQASLRALDVAPAEITVPLFGGIWRAVLGEPDFSLYLAGPTGQGKSELAALAQQRFGASMTRLHLPASFDSTGNAIQILQHRAKDAVLVVDDFCPAGSFADQARLNKDADRVFRGQGNHTGRQRLNADATSQASRPVRCLTLGTGEDLPAGHSLRARMLVLEVAPDAVQWELLSGCQQDAAAGLYAQTTAAFVQWLAGRYAETREWYTRELPVWREKAQRSAVHRRTPVVLADLLLAWSLFFAFAVEVGALERAEVDGRLDAMWDVLGATGAAQASHQQGAEPAGRFLELLRGAIGSGRADIAGADGGAPDQPAAWGWRETSVGGGEYTRTEWRPLGERVGWVSGDDLYLASDPAYAAVQRLGRDGGDGIVITVQTLRKRLNQHGYLRSVDDKRQTLTVRRTLEHSIRDVLHLIAGALRLTNALPGDPDDPNDDPGGGRDGVPSAAVIDREPQRTHATPSISSVTEPPSEQATAAASTGARVFCGGGMHPPPGACTKPDKPDKPDRDQEAQAPWEPLAGASRVPIRLEPDNASILAGCNNQRYPQTSEVSDAESAELASVDAYAAHEAGSGNADVGFVGFPMGGAAAPAMSVPAGVSEPPVLSGSQAGLATSRAVEAYPGLYPISWTPRHWA